MTDETTIIADPSIILTRLTAENFRALGYAVFEPLTDGGMTAINGSNGTGKSSLLVALCWCLYGVTPDGMTAKNLRRQGSEGQLCKVVANFSHHGQNIEVERGLKGKNDSPYARISVDGVEQVVGKVSVASQWILERLGSREAFLTAFVIRQKELDQLVKAVPSERRALIERLAGIDRMSDAVKNARVEENDAKKKLQYLPGSDELVAQAEEELKRCAVEQDHSKKACNKAAEEFQKIVEVIAEKKQQYDNVEKISRQHAELSEQIKTTQQNLALVDEKLTIFKENRSKYPQKLDDNIEQKIVDISSTVDEKNATLDRARDLYHRINAAQQEKQKLSTILDEAKNNLETEEKKLAEAKQQLVLFDEKKEKRAASKLEKQRSELQETFNTNKSIVLSSENKIVETSDAINLLSKSAQATCPTCTQNIDDISGVVNTLQKVITEAQTLKDTAVEDNTAITVKINDLNTKLAEYENRVRQYEKTKENADEAELRTVFLKRKVLTNEEMLNEIVAGLESMTAEQNSYSPETLSKEVKELTDQKYALQQNVDRMREAFELDEKIQKFEASRVKGQQMFEQQQQQLDDLNFDAQKMVTLQKELSELVEKRNVLNIDWNTNKNVYDNAKEGYVRAQKNYRDEQEKNRARLEALADYENKSATTNALDVFRKDRIARISPEISEIGTELITKMTEGKYISLELSEDFTPMVTDIDGNVRPSTWLSGGEESNVALALRLAIGELISGSQGGLLWMDEPQAAMDDKRRPAMMAAIREMKGRQPIIISHASEASDMVDMIFDVIPNKEDGSSLTTGGNTAEMVLSNIE